MSQHLVKDNLIIYRRQQQFSLSYLLHTNISKFTTNEINIYNNKKVNQC